MTVCKEIKRTYGLTFGQNKSLTNKAKLRPDEKLRYRLAEEVKLTLEASRNWHEFSNKLTSYGIRADIRFRSGTTIPQGICFTKYGATFKGSSLDRTLSFSQIDKTLSGESMSNGVHRKNTNLCESLNPMAKTYLLWQTFPALPPILSSVCWIQESAEDLRNRI